MYVKARMVDTEMQSATLRQRCVKNRPVIATYTDLMFSNCVPDVLKAVCSILIERVT